MSMCPCVSGTAAHALAPPARAHGKRRGGEGRGGPVEVAVKMIGGRLEHMALPFGAIVLDIKAELEEKRGVERTKIVLIHRGKVCGDMERATAGALYMHCHPQSGCNR